MCYAVPAEITSVEGDTATVDYGGVKKKVNTSFVKNPRVGDYLLIHAGFAIEKLDKKTAQETLKLISSLFEHG